MDFCADADTEPDVSSRAKTDQSTLTLEMSSSTSVLEFYEPNPAKAGFAAKTLEARLGQVGPAGFSGRGTD